MRYFSLIVLATFLTVALARAEGPDDLYVKVYNLIQQGDDFSRAEQNRSAFERYQQAQKSLQSIRETFPEWNPKLLEFRISYVNDRLKAFGVNPPAAPATPAPATTVPSPSSPASAASPAAAGPVKAELTAAVGSMERQVGALMEENRALKYDRTILEAKLREALAAQPATVDAREVAKAEEKVRGLQKENELLKVTLKQEQDRLKSMTPEGAQNALSEATRQVAEQSKSIEILRQEKQILETRLQATGEGAQFKSLRNENDTLKQQIADLQARLEAANTNAPAPPAAQPAPAKPASKAEAKAARANAQQIQKLEKERDDLKKQIAALKNETAKQKPKPAAAEKPAKAPKNARTPVPNDLQNQVKALQARLDAYETQKIPYTEQELALMAKVETPARSESAAAGATDKKSPGEMPAEANALVAEAQRAFADGKMEEAEKKYKQVLRINEKSIITLGNLATVQMEANRLADAEDSLKKAIALDPNDGHNLSLWGLLKFRQEKYDEALESLSQAAKLDANNASIQNYLGLALSQKGQREAAERALRRAIQLSPEYATAHYNLAVVYAFQNPPFLALARYHYDKSIKQGYPKNPDLEKILDGK